MLTSFRIIRGRQNHVVCHHHFALGRTREIGIIVKSQPQIHLHSSEKKKDDSRREKKSNQKEKQWPVGDLANGSKLSCRAESFIFAKNKTHPGLTF